MSHAYTVAQIACNGQAAIASLQSLDGVKTLTRRNLILRYGPLMAEDTDEVGLCLLGKLQHRVETLLHHGCQFGIAFLKQFGMTPPRK